MTITFGYLVCPSFCRHLIASFCCHFITPAFAQKQTVERKKVLARKCPHPEEPPLGGVSKGSDYDAPYPSRHASRSSG